MFGYYRLASAVPQLRVAEVDYNVDQLTEGFRKAAEQQAAAVVFPELCITGYSCGDLFFQPNLRKAALNGLLRFTEATEGSGTIAVVGLPFLHEDALYNTAAAFWLWCPKPCSPTTGNSMKNVNSPPAGNWVQG